MCQIYIPTASFFRGQHRRPAAQRGAKNGEGAQDDADGQGPPRGARLPRPPQGGLRRARRRPRARQWLSFLGYLIRKLRLGSGEGSTNQPTLFSIHFCATSVKMFLNNCWYLDKYSSRLSPGRAISLRRYSRRTGGTRTPWFFCTSSTAKYPHCNFLFGIDFLRSLRLDTPEPA